MRAALEHATHQLTVHPLQGSRLDCPVTVPPHLFIVEAEPRAPVALILAAATRHATLGRVPALVVLDHEWLSLAPRLACADFIARGFGTAEALARVDRLLGALRSPEPDQLRFGDLLIDLRGVQAQLGQRPLALTPQEFALLRHLALHEGRAQSRDVLLRRVWGLEYTGGTRTVDIHVRRLRAKLGEDAAAHLQTVRQVGYKWSVTTR